MRVRPFFVLTFACLIARPGARPTAAADLTIRTPLEHQIVQRSKPGTADVPIAAESPVECPPGAVLEARLGPADDTADDVPWQRIDGTVDGRRLAGSLALPSGGWWSLELRVVHGGTEFARGRVQRVGAGEVFVVAGQSNSANHGEERQKTRTRRVASFDGSSWRIADDPQNGASGDQGSFMPPLGDMIVERFDVPVGFVACGIGATSVREWLPKGATFPAPPTIESRVEPLGDGTWASKGEAFDHFVARMRSFGPGGFRAVLWHQGESDANQRDASRTLAGPLYREYLGRLIIDSRRAIGWEPQWFVAQASYHVPGDEGSDDIRAAQSAVCRDGLALAGPDTDALKGHFRARDGRDVHFSASGLRAHAAAWADVLLPWLEGQNDDRTAPGDDGERSGESSSGTPIPGG